MKQIIHTQNAPAAIGPYSQAVIANGFLYISGQIPVNPQTGEVITDITEATHQAMLNLKAILDEANCTFDHVIKTTIFITSMDDFQAVNDVYASYFTTNQFPARETVAVAGLPKNVSVEISMIASLNP